METITKDQAADLIRGSKGKLFSVRFTKRSNGAPRKMVGRLGVRKGVNGNGQPFTPGDHNLLVVHEFVTDPDTTRGEGGKFAGGGNMTTQFRHIPIERITGLKISGKIFQVN